MGLFPVIQSPCPYKGDLSDIMDDSLCRLCKREVVDITAMSDAERVALVAGCPDELCVSYKVAARSALAAMAMGAAVASLPAAAKDVQLVGGPAQAAAGEDWDDMMIIVGGLRKPAETKWVKEKGERTKPDLPVVYDDAPAAPKKDRAAKARPTA